MGFGAGADVETASTLGCPRGRRSRRRCDRGCSVAMAGPGSWDRESAHRMIPQNSPARGRDSARKSVGEEGERLGPSVFARAAQRAHSQTDTYRSLGSSVAVAAYLCAWPALCIVWPAGAPHPLRISLPFIRPPENDYWQLPCHSMPDPGPFAARCPRFRIWPADGGLPLDSPGERPQYAAILSH